MRTCFYFACVLAVIAHAYLRAFIMRTCFKWFTMMFVCGLVVLVHQNIQALIVKRDYASVGISMKQIISHMYTCVCYRRVLAFVSHAYLRFSMIYRNTDGSDTDSTADENDVAGDGKYSHGEICLTHQHWVDQIISSGTFAIHDTEGPEAVHKLCMYNSYWLSTEISNRRRQE